MYKNSTTHHKTARSYIILYTFSTLYTTLHNLTKHFTNFTTKNFAKLYKKCYKTIHTSTQLYTTLQQSTQLHNSLQHAYNTSTELTQLYTILQNYYTLQKPNKLTPIVHNFTKKKTVHNITKLHQQPHTKICTTWSKTN